MTTPTDRAYGIAARELLAGITGIWDLDLFREALDRRAAAIDASKPDCPFGESTFVESWGPGCGLGSSAEHAKPIHAEAVEALPEQMNAWNAPSRYEDGERQAWADGYNKGMKAALAARPEAAGGAEPVAVGLITETTDGWLDNVQLTEVGKRLPVGEHKFYTARPAAVGGELPEPVSYQRLFDAIGSAVHVPYPGAREISVAQFKRSLGLEKDDPIFTVCATQPQQLAEDTAGAVTKATLRDALAYVGQRTDGDVATLAERAELWMRESKSLIDNPVPQRLAVTDEAVTAAYEYLRGKSWTMHSLRDAICLALPHLARKETT